MSKTMTIEELKKNGWFEHDGKQYVLLQQAYADGTTEEQYYTATAICSKDKPDEDDLLPCYEVIWSLKDEFVDYCKECNEAGDWIDESLACDWEHPESIRLLSCGYLLSENRII